MSATDPNFTNFSFLENIDERLYELTLSFEGTYYYEADISIGKARVVLDYICKSLDASWYQDKKKHIDGIYDKGIIDSSVRAQMQGIRKLGNFAIHPENDSCYLGDTILSSIRTVCNSIGYNNNILRNQLTPTLSDCVFRLIFKLTIFFAKTRNVTISNTIQFTKPFDLIGNMDNRFGILNQDKEKLVKEVQKQQDLIRGMTADAEELQSAIEKRDSLETLWSNASESEIVQPSLLEQITLLKNSITIPEHMSGSIAKWCSEDVSTFVSKEKEEWRKSLDLQNGRIEELKNKITEKEKQINILKDETIQFVSWTENYPNAETEDNQIELWKCRSEFLTDRLFNGKSPFEPWRIKPKKLGSGGWGTAYKCTPKSGEKQYVVKIAKGDISDNIKVSSLQSIWVKDAEIATQLSKLKTKITGFAYPRQKGDIHHPGFTIYELIKGENLKSQLSKKEFSITKAIYICCKIATTVSSLRKYGIWYTDLSANNIILRDSGLIPTLIDPTPLRPGTISRFPEEWYVDGKPINLLTGVVTDLPESGQLYLVARLFLSMINPKHTSNFIIEEESSIDGVLGQQDTGVQLERLMHYVESSVHSSVDALEKEQRVVFELLGQEKIIKLLFHSVHPDPKFRQKPHPLDFFCECLLKYIDPMKVLFR